MKDENKPKPRKKIYTRAERENYEAYLKEKQLNFF